MAKLICITSFRMPILICVGGDTTTLHQYDFRTSCWMSDIGKSHRRPSPKTTNNNEASISTPILTSKVNAEAGFMTARVHHVDLLPDQILSDHPREEFH